jgi:short-subunit dehydrogenase
MEALSDALRLELRQWRIPVSLVEPGATSTAIFGKTLAHLDGAAAALHERAEHRYDAQMAAIRRTVQSTAAGAAPATDLAQAIFEALTAKAPKARYLAGHGAREAIALARMPSDRLKDAAIAHEVGLPDPE